MSETWTADQYRAAQKKMRRKYGNRPVIVDGIRFDSKREAAYYGELKMREKAGEVSEVELQRRFALVGGDGILITTYVADFYFFDHIADRFRCIDVKGYVTREFTIKRRLMKSFLGIEVEIVR